MKFIGIILVSMCFNFSLEAAGFAVKGNYRMRSNSLRNLHFDSNQKTSYRNYIDHRFRLNSAFVANDYIVIKSDIDFFGNCLELSGSSFGCLMGYNEDDKDYSSTIDYSSFPGRHVLFNRWVPVGDSKTLNVRRLWTQINTRYGVLSVGRQPDAWGVGVFANSGDGVFDNYGDSLDRIQFDMKFGSLDFAPYYGIFSDRDIDSTEDIYEMGLKTRYNMVDTNNVYGLYMAFRSSRADNDNVSTYALFADHHFGIFNLVLELVFQNGSIDGKSIDANGILFRGLRKLTRSINSSVELGYASGNDLSGNKHGEFYFNPDFKPALILFAHEHGVAPFSMRGKDLSGDFNYPASVHNALYLKPRVDFSFNNSNLDISFIWARRNHSDARSTSGLTLGYELDFVYKYQANENLFYGVDLAILLPGDYYEGLDNKNKKLTFASFMGLRLGVMF